MYLSRGFDGLAVIDEALGIHPERTGTRVQACLPPHVAVPVPGPCKGWRHKIKTIRPRKRKTANVGDSLFDLQPPPAPITPEQKAEIRKIYGGTFGGLTARVTGLTRDKRKGNKRLKVEGIIFNADGDEVGDFTRELYEKDGQRWIHHDFLSLNKEYQGQGFATDWNAQAMAWYRDHDVAGVELQADIDIGGIAWARKGYDWMEDIDAKGVQDRILNTLNDMATGDHWMGGEGELDSEPRQWWKMPPERIQEQVRAAAEMRRRMLSTPFGSDDYPTPFEISEVGRWPGARFAGDIPGDEGDWWIGRVIMTGSDWYGVTIP